MAGKIIDEDVLKLTVQNLTQLIADHVFEEEEYTPEQVESLFDCTPEQLQFYESIINPDIVSETRLWASKTISDKIEEAIIQANEYSDGLIKDISSIQLEWCETSLPTTGESNKIYILPTTVDSNVVNTLNIWNTKTSAYVSIGNLEIDLSQYYTKSEMDTKLNDKANKSEVLAVNKVQTTTGAETHDNVYSAKLTKTELDKKANDDEVVKKTDISTTIDSASTDTQVPSAKAVFTPIDKIQENLTSLTTVTDLDNFKGKYFMIGRGTAYNNECVNVPNGVTGAFVVEYLPYDNGDYYGVQRLTLVQSVGGKYSTFERSLDNRNWMGWQRVCTTSVADVPWTSLTPTSVLTRGIIRYRVKNGICYVKMDDIISTTMSTNNQTFVTGLPKPEQGIVADSWYPLGSNVNSSSASFQNLLVRVTGNGNIINHYGIDNVSYFGSFSYPVAE